MKKVVHGYDPESTPERIRERLSEIEETTATITRERLSEVEKEVSTNEKKLRFIASVLGIEEQVEAALSGGDDD